jgi:AcrR family transcriptional regulator
VTAGSPRRASHTGRRPGSADTRGRILAAARATFGERGFDAATIRDIAERAEVDPALVHHYFGSKQQLFVSAMELPVDFQAIVPRLLDGPREELGERFVRFVLELWEAPAMRPLLLGLVRSATTDPVAASMLRGLIAEGRPRPRQRDRPADAPLARRSGPQFIGFGPHAWRLSPGGRFPRGPQRGPTIQRYLTGDLDGSPSRAAGGLGVDGRASPWQGRRVSTDPAACRPSPRSVTFMTDIEGSAPLRASDPMPAVLEAHDTILRASIEGAGGAVIKTTGDGVLARFEDPVAALEGALHGQRELRPLVSSWLAGPDGATLGAQAEGDSSGMGAQPVARLRDRTRRAVLSPVKPPLQAIDWIVTLPSTAASTPPRPRSPKRLSARRT